MLGEWKSAGHLLMMPCSPQPANRKHISSVSKILVFEKDVFAVHIAHVL
jgi:hypothetical protein